MAGKSANQGIQIDTGEKIICRSGLELKSGEMELKKMAASNNSRGGKCNKKICKKQ